MQAVSNQTETVPETVSTWLDTGEDARRRIPGCVPATEIFCDRSAAAIRTIGGQCNNLEHPFLGRALTGLGRLANATFEDGLYFSPRSLGAEVSPLPAADAVGSLVAAQLHSEPLGDWASTVSEYLSLDLARIAPFRLASGREPDCCSERHPACLPLHVDDRCVSFVRALPASALDCVMRPAAPLSAASSYLDLETLYGSSEEAGRRLRTFRGGRLRADRGLLIGILDQVLDLDYELTVSAEQSPSSEKTPSAALPERQEETERQLGIDAKVVTFVKGDKGQKGRRGRKGNKGSKGRRGNKGVCGMKGNSGIDGDKGEKGIKGGDGAKGTKGSKGAKGAKGESGEKGMKGMKGDKGRKGEKGNKGDSGEDGDDGADGSIGEGGSKGLTGRKGRKGGVGDKGVKGDKGMKGSKGEFGELGIKGNEGMQGAKGVQGTKGQKGSKGEFGMKGDFGGDGSKGDRGLIGMQGVKGRVGQWGRPGAKGDEGRRGPEGDQGDKGEDGHRGRQGRPGPRGLPGGIRIILPNDYSNSGQNQHGSRPWQPYGRSVGSADRPSVPSPDRLNQILLREHNRVADALRRNNPSWEDERVFQSARRVVMSEWQHIIYHEYLPHVLGAAAAAGVTAHTETKAEHPADPTVSVEFALAAFRFWQWPPSEEAIQAAPRVSSSAAFLAMVRGPIGAPPNVTGAELAAVEVLRGREMGLPAYDTVRQLCSGTSLTSWEELGSVFGRAELEALRSIYASPEDVDLWVGGMLERRAQSARVGPTFQCVIADQFRRHRDGDRLFYERSLSDGQLREVRKASLARLLCDNEEGRSRAAPLALEPLTEWNKPTLCTSSTIPQLDLSVF
ncbi:chorion peroxidase-like isoform X2 [Amphibalanus amphitrite]|nr:chorion peroxidase-like isoform X2 [Amphibalanus amphitrite]